MSIDLDLFCDDSENSKPGRDLSRPFSINGYTYATDGCIAVRVPRRTGIPENKDAPNAEQKLPWNFKRVKFGPLPEPELLSDECMECYGQGHKHACPDCRCKCEACNGSGKSPSRVFIGDVVFRGHYIELMRALPELEIEKPKPQRPLSFRFKGGEGLLMPMDYGR